MFLRDFLRAKADGTLDGNVSWRAYDIPGTVAPLHTRNALKVIGLDYAGELAVGEFAARYGVDVEAAPQLLGEYWLLREVERGGRPRGLRLRSAPVGPVAG